MKKSYGERPATSNGHESCGVAREGDVETLTGERVGRVLAAKETPSGTPTPQAECNAPTRAPISRGAPGSRAVRDPEHARMYFAGEPGDPVCPDARCSWQNTSQIDS